jgi:uncharacterized protein
MGVMKYYYAMWLVLCWCVWAQAAEEELFFSVPGNATVSLYSEPSTRATVLGQIPSQAVAVQYISCDIEDDVKNLYSRVTVGKRGWCQVSYQGFYGWAQKEYLRAYSVPDAFPFECDPQALQQKSKQLESVICNDFELNNLEKMMVTTYAHAQQKASLLNRRFKNYFKSLETSHKQWERSRGQCLNRDYWDRLTCLSESYQIRLTYLQAKFGLVRYSDAQRFVCAGKAFMITYYNTDYLPSLTINNGENRDVMIDYIHDSETRYSGDDGRYVLLSGNQAVIKLDNNRPEMRCTRQ